MVPLMTEMQILALQQASLGLASFHRDHLLIKSKAIVLDPGDGYNIAKVDMALRVADIELRALCAAGGITYLVGDGTL